MTEEEQIKLIDEDISNVLNIEDPTDFILLIVARRCPPLILRLLEKRAIPEDILVEACLADEGNFVINFFKDLISMDNLKNILLARKKDKTLFKLIFPLLDKDRRLEIIKDAPELIININELDEEIKRIAVSSDPHIIILLENPSKELQRIAIEINYHEISFIENPDEEIQFLAVNKNIFIFPFIKNPSYLVKKFVLEKAPEMIFYIEDQTEELIKIALFNGLDDMNLIKEESIKKIKDKEILLLYLARQ